MGNSPSSMDSKSKSLQLIECGTKSKLNIGKFHYKMERLTKV